MITFYNKNLMLYVVIGTREESQVRLESGWAFKKSMTIHMHVLEVPFSPESSSFWGVWHNPRLQANIMR